jgi:hypothetical protein
MSKPLRLFCLLLLTVILILLCTRASHAQYVCASAEGDVEEKIIVVTPYSLMDCKTNGVCVRVSGPGISYQLKVSGPDPYTYAYVTVPYDIWLAATLYKTFPWPYGQNDPCAGGASVVTPPDEPSSEPDISSDTQPL